MRSLGATKEFFSLVLRVTLLIIKNCFLTKLSIPCEAEFIYAFKKDEHELGQKKLLATKKFLPLI